MENYIVFYVFLSRNIFLLPFGLASSLMSYPLLEMILSSIHFITCTVLVLPLIFDLFTLVRSLMYSSLRISLKLNGFRVLSLDSVIYLSKYDAI